MNANIVGGVSGIAKRMLSNTAPGRYITGSDSPAFVRLNQSKRPDIDPDDIDWGLLAADPEAGSWPRHRHNVGILATGHSIYSELDPDYLRTPGKVKDAVAWVSEGIVEIGVNPKADNLFGSAVIDGESRFAVGRRLEQTRVLATIGLLVVEKNQFIPASPISVAEESLPIGEIAGERFRHIPVV